MDDGYHEIDAFVSVIKENTNFLNRLFFPKIRLALAIGVLVMALALRFILA